MALSIGPPLTQSNTNTIRITLRLCPLPMRHMACTLTLTLGPAFGSPQVKTALSVNSQLALMATTVERVAHTPRAQLPPTATVQGDLDLHLNN